MEVSHANLAKVTRMIFVEIGSVVVLSTSHTTSTRMLTVLADTTVAGGDVAATVKEMCQLRVLMATADWRTKAAGASYCLRVFVNRVGIFATDRRDGVDAVKLSGQKGNIGGGRQEPRLGASDSALSHPIPALLPSSESRSQGTFNEYSQ